ncbi:MAG: COX aromatic rich motif-containing protein, partial [bacterium]|nr:COX aromatic rich motif-containing protein [bacterium]
LMLIALALMALAVIPVFIATVFIARKYREGNVRAEYIPEQKDSMKQLLWFGFTGSIILILAVITWKSTHALDPYRPLASNVPPVRIQVVALQWKWLFIYPEQRIATVNFIQFPERTPVNFELTADAPMNSFWIPQLGGQIYAMPGMSTKLHLMADEPGDFPGVSAEISGRGFAGMKFIARASSQADFDAWVDSVKNSGNALMMDEYKRLAVSSENEPAAFYASTEDDLYNKVIEKFMSPTEQTQQGMETDAPQMMPEMQGVER